MAQCPSHCDGMLEGGGWMAAAIAGEKWKINFCLSENIYNKY